MAIERRIFVKATIVLGLALASFVANGAAPNRSGLDLHRILGEENNGTGTPVKLFDVTSYGAKEGDETGDTNTEAFMKAWRAACDLGASAKVVVPEGTFLTAPMVFQGPCKSTKPIIFEVKGNLKATTDMSAYEEGVWIAFEYIDGLILTGGGSFDGQGASVWKYNDCHQNKDCQPLPDSIKFFKVNNSNVDDISSINSKYFHLHVVYCNNITFHNLTLSAPSNSPNTDGIHISNSNLIKISNSLIGTGDDCVSIGRGATNITVSQVVCGPGHGLSVGSLGKYENEKDVNGVLMINCTLTNTTNGARIKSYPDSKPSQASNIVFQDIIVENVKNPIIIDQKYGSHKSQPSRVKISDVHFKNIKGTSTSNVAVNLLCSSLVPCEGVQFENIDLVYSGEKKRAEPISASCLNAKVVSVGTQNPPACQ